jgi:phosphatidylglycerol:prolipoprotein diacylglycerol transferase
VRRRAGDVAGIFLLGAGFSIYLTELWRDPEGRGSFLSGALDGPQLAAILFVLIGASILIERKHAKQSFEAAHG